MKNKFWLLLALSAILSSCSMMKSKYGRGVSFHWKSGHTQYLVHQEIGEGNNGGLSVADNEEVNIEDRLIVASLKNTDLPEVSLEHSHFPAEELPSFETVSAEGLNQSLKAFDPANKSAIVPTEQEVKGEQNKGPEDKWLLILLAFFLPPLTIYLLDETDTQGLIISVILTLVGCYITGVIHAIIKVVKKYDGA